MDKFAEDLNLGRRLLAAYKDRLNFLGHIDNMDPILSSGAEDADTDLDGPNKAGETLVKDERKQKKD